MVARRWGLHAYTPGAWIGAHMYGPGKFAESYEAGVQGLAQAMIIQNKSPAPLLPGRAPRVVAPWIGAHMYGSGKFTGGMKQLKRASLRR